MGAEAVCPCHLPQAADLNRIVAVFATAPYANNPDGADRHPLHLDAGAARGAAFNLGGGNLVPFDDDLNPVLPQFNAIKAANFNPLRGEDLLLHDLGARVRRRHEQRQRLRHPERQFVVTLGALRRATGRRTRRSVRSSTSSDTTSGCSTAATRTRTTSRTT